MTKQVLKLPSFYRPFYTLQIPFSVLWESRLNKWQQAILVRDNRELGSKFKTRHISAAISFILTPLKLFPALSWCPLFGPFCRNHSVSPILKSATQAKFAYLLTSSYLVCRVWKKHLTGVSCPPPPSVFVKLLIVHSNNEDQALPSAAQHRSD